MLRYYIKLGVIPSLCNLYNQYSPSSNFSILCGLIYRGHREIDTITSTNIYIYIYIYICVCVYKYVCIYVCVYLYICIYMSVYICVCMCVCVCVCVCLVSSGQFLCRPTFSFSTEFMRYSAVSLHSDQTNKQTNT